MRLRLRVNIRLGSSNFTVDHNNVTVHFWLTGFCSTHRRLEPSKAFLAEWRCEYLTWEVIPPFWDCLFLVLPAFSELLCSDCICFWINNKLISMDWVPKKMKLIAKQCLMTDEGINGGHPYKTHSLDLFESAGSPWRQSREWTLRGVITPPNYWCQGERECPKCYRPLDCSQLKTSQSLRLELSCRLVVLQLLLARPAWGNQCQACSLSIQQKEVACSSGYLQQSWSIGGFV